MANQIGPKDSFDSDWSAVTKWPFQLSDHAIQNCQTGEQMTHWAMLNKENSNLVALFNMS